MIPVPSAHGMRICTALVAATLCAALGAQSRLEVPRPGGQGGPAASPGNAPGTMPMNNQSRWAPGNGMGGNFNQVPTPSHSPAGARPADLPPRMSNAAYQPRALPRCTTLPAEAFWRSRDLFAEMRFLSRRGFIEVVPVAEETTGILGATWFPSGWKAYGFTVPAHETLHVRLRHPNEGWFRLLMVNKWGQMGQGMLQNLIPTGNPEVTFKSLSGETQNVYVIVDDPGWMSSKENPFNLTVERSWDPAKRKAEPVPQVVGIWAARVPEPDPKAKPEADKAAVPAPAAPKG